MTTVQAFWFRADDDERGLDPDHEAFTPMDVLNVVRRLDGAETSRQARARCQGSYPQGHTPPRPGCQVLRRWTY